MEVAPIPVHELNARGDVEVRNTLLGNRELYRKLLTDYLEGPEVFQRFPVFAKCLSRLSIVPALNNETTMVIKSATAVHSFWLNSKNFAKQACSPQAPFELFLALHAHSGLSLANAMDAQGEHIIEVLKRRNQREGVDFLHQHGFFSPQEIRLVTDRWLFNAESKIAKWLQVGSQPGHYPELPPFQGRPAPNWHEVINQLVTSSQENRPARTFLLRDIGLKILRSDCSDGDVEKLYLILRKVDLQAAVNLLESAAALGLISHFRILYRILQYKSKDAAIREDLMYIALKNRHSLIADLLLSSFELPHRSLNCRLMSQLCGSLFQRYVSEQCATHRMADVDYFMINFFLDRGMSIEDLTFDFGGNQPHRTIRDQIIQEIANHPVTTVNSLERQLYLVARLSRKVYRFYENANFPILLSNGFDPYWIDIERKDLPDQARVAYLHYLVETFDSNNDWYKTTLHDYLRDASGLERRLGEGLKNDLLKRALDNGNRACVFTLLVLLPYVYGRTVYIDRLSEWLSKYPEINNLIDQAKKNLVLDQKDWEISSAITDDSIDEFLTSYRLSDDRVERSFSSKTPSTAVARLLAGLLAAFSKEGKHQLTLDQTRDLDDCQSWIVEYAAKAVEIDGLRRHSQEIATHRLQKIAVRTSYLLKGPTIQLVPCRAQELILKFTRSNYYDDLSLSLYDSRKKQIHFYKLHDYPLSLMGVDETRFQQLMMSDAKGVYEALKPYQVLDVTCGISTPFDETGTFGAFFWFLRATLGPQLYLAFRSFALVETCRLSQSREGRFLNSSTKDHMSHIMASHSFQGLQAANPFLGSDEHVQLAIKLFYKPLQKMIS